MKKSQYPGVLRFKKPINKSEVSLIYLLELFILLF